MLRYLSNVLNFPLQTYGHHSFAILFFCFGKKYFFRFPLQSHSGATRVAPLLSHARPQHGPVLLRRDARGVSVAYCSHGSQRERLKVKASRILCCRLIFVLQLFIEMLSVLKNQAEVVLFCSNESVAFLLRVFS